MIDAIQDPRLRSLAAALPIMRNGQPRKFRLYCECYEWMFTQMQRRARQLNSHYVDVSSLIETVDRTAKALWHHQNPRAPMPSSAPVAASEKEVLGTNQSRSPDAATSAEQPSGNAAVEPTRKDGWAGERDTDLSAAADAGPFDVQETTESCGGVEGRHAEKLGGGGPQCDSANTGKADRPTPAAGVAPGPQDLLEESRFPAHMASAEQPSGNAAVEPTRKDGNTGERDPIDLTIPAFLRRASA